MDDRLATARPPGRGPSDAEIEAAERRGRPGLLEMGRIGLFLGGTLAGGIGGGLLALTAGAGSHHLGMLAGAVGVVAVEIRKSCLLAARGAAFDAPEAQRLIERIRAKVPTGAVAARRARAWVVYTPGAPEPEVMSEREYAAYAAATPDLSEIVLEGRGVTLSRLKDGKLHTRDTGEPALELYDLDTGLVLAQHWYVAGVEVSPEVAAIYHDAIREEIARWKAGEAEPLAPGR